MTYDDLGGEEDGENGSLFTVPYHHHQSQQTSSQHQSKNQQRRPSLPHVEMVRPAQTKEEKESEDDQTTAKIPKRVEYKEEERRHLMQSETFRKFIDRAVRITERALSCTDSIDIFVDYTGQVECVDRYFIQYYSLFYFLQFGFF